MSNFIPDYSAMPLMGQYVGLYRLFSDQDWHQVRANGNPILHPTWTAARNAAKAHVEARLNPPVRVEVSGDKGVDLVMDAQIARLRHQADQQQRAFGGVVVKGKTTKVEKRRLR